MTTFTPLFNKEQSSLYSSYNRKIAVLQRSLNYLSSLTTLSESQTLRFNEVKKDLKVFRCKKTKLENMCVLF